MPPQPPPPPPPQHRRFSLNVHVVAGCRFFGSCARPPSRCSCSEWYRFPLISRSSRSPLSLSRLPFSREAAAVQHSAANVAFMPRCTRLLPHLHAHPHITARGRTAQCALASGERHLHSVSSTLPQPQLHTLTLLLLQLCWCRPHTARAIRNQDIRCRSCAKQFAS